MLLKRNANRAEPVLLKIIMIWQSVSDCATQADVRAAVDQQTLISKLDQQTYGLADSTYALNNTINQNFRGIDNAICNLGYQAAQHANNLSSQLAQCLKKLFTKNEAVGTCMA